MDQKDEVHKQEILDLKSTFKSENKQVDEVVRNFEDNLMNQNNCHKVELKKLMEQKDFHITKLEDQVKI